MIFNFLRSSLSILLIFSLMLCCSCTQNETDTPIENAELSIETTEVEKLYSNEEKSLIAQSVLEVFSDIVYNSEGAVLNEKLKEKALIIINEDIIPIMEDVISFEEFEKLNITNLDLKTPRSLAKAYISSSQIIGSDDCGLLTYKLLASYLNIQEKINTERYESFSQNWHLENAERYKRQSAELEGISSSDFSTLFGAFSLIVSAADSADMFDGNINADDAPDILLTFMRRQAKMLDKIDKKTIASTAKLIFELAFNEFDAPEGLNILSAEEWYAMAENYDGAYEIGKTLYTFIDLYCDLAYSMTRNDAEIILSGNKQDALMTFSAIIMKCENSFCLWVDELLTCSLASSAEPSIILETGHAKAFMTFSSERNDITSDDLLRILSACAADGSPEHIAALDRALTDLSFKIAPYATYVIYSNLSGGILNDQS